LCLGTRGYGYKGTRIHAVIPGQYIAGGDYQFGTGEGGASIYGRPFPDEDTKLRHIGPGVLSMARYEMQGPSRDVCCFTWPVSHVSPSLTPNENGSLFMFTMAKAPIHDHRYMAFGNVMSGIEVLRSLEQLGSWRGDVQVSRVSNCIHLPCTAQSRLSWVVCNQSNVRIADCGELTISKDDEAAAIAVAEGTKALPPSSETNQ
jgi:peptidyl-prolyl cis-trans isomerase B (cyclophilin B)